MIKHKSEHGTRFGIPKWIFFLFFAAVICGFLLIFLGGFVAASLGISLFEQKGCVGVIKVYGPITLESSSGGLFSVEQASSDEIRELITEAGRQQEIKAVVFEINSPGGSAVASREIYDEAKKLNKPTVSYFREVAASGGYYIASGTDYIISDKDSLTGSIGVRATVEDMSDLFEKIGFNMTTFKSGEMKDMGDPSRPLTENESAVFQEIISDAFEGFKQAVISSRGSNLKQSDYSEVFDGRIMSGKRAYRYGLVDELGSKDDAIRKAAQLGGIELSEGKEPSVCELSKNRGLFSEVLSSFYNAGFLFGSGFAQGVRAQEKVSVES